MQHAQGHTADPVQEQGLWHPAVEVPAQLAVALKASLALGDCGAARASQKAQPHRAPTPKLGPSQEGLTLPTLCLLSG